VLKTTRLTCTTSVFDVGGHGRFFNLILGTSWRGGEVIWWPLCARWRARVTDLLEFLQRRRGGHREGYSLPKYGSYSGLHSQSASRPKPRRS
jgi:hypothetical protein